MLDDILLLSMNFRPQIVPGGSVGRLLYVDEDAHELDDAPVQIKLNAALRIVTLTGNIAMVIPDVSLSFEAWLAATHKRSEQQYDD